MNRREFTIEAAMALLGGAVITIGCGSSSPTASTPPPPDALGTVDTNHGHAVTVTSAQLVAGAALELDIRGTSGHTHTVYLDVYDIAGIRNGARVQKQSSGASHVHTVMFN